MGAPSVGSPYQGVNIESNGGNNSRPSNNESGTDNNEAALEVFRRQWREEVKARNVATGGSGPLHTSQQPLTQRTPVSAASAPAPAPPAQPHATKRLEDLYEDVEPRSYHDLPDKELGLQLGSHDDGIGRPAPHREPSSALEHYEHAVEKESQGQLGASITHYRKAFKMDDGVHEAYKKKHFPASMFARPAASGSVPKSATSSASTAKKAVEAQRQTAASVSATSSVRQLLDAFAALSIEAPPPPTDASPEEKCPLAQLPEEILTHVLELLAMTDFQSFARTALVCKRLAYLVMTEESVWKRICLNQNYGFPAMHYDYACKVNGRALDLDDVLSVTKRGKADVEESVRLMPEEKALIFSQATQDLVHAAYRSSWRQMFRLRPRIRFNGCYISTVNYTRAGANSSNTLTWGVPVLVVTYFRYLRFFRDGTVISLLTTVEPADVVHHLTKENMHNHHHAGSMLPSAVMKDALRGRWHLSGPAGLMGVDDEEAEEEGDVHIETEGVVPKYTYKMHFRLGHAGKGARNNKLAWKGFWSWNKLTDDWGEFGLKNDRAYYFSRVLSYR